MTLVILANVLAVLNISHSQGEDLYLSPIEVVERGEELLESDPIRVVFRVANVDTMPVVRVEGSRFNQVRMHPTEEINTSFGGSFYVAFSEKTEELFARIGIGDLEKHFKGKEVEVTGRLHATTLNLPGSDTYWFYHLEVSDLDQLQSVEEK